MTNPIKPAAAQASPSQHSPLKHASATLQAPAVKRALKRLGRFLCDLALVPCAYIDGLVSPVISTKPDEPLNKVLLAAFYIGKLTQYCLLALLAAVAITSLNHLANFNYGMFAPKPEFNIDYKSVIIIIMALIFIMCLPALISALAIIVAYSAVFISIVWSATFLTAYLLVLLDIHVSGPVTDILVWIVTLGGLL